MLKSQKNKNKITQFLHNIIGIQQMNIGTQKQEAGDLVGAAKVMYTINNKTYYYI